MPFRVVTLALMLVLAACSGWVYYQHYFVRRHCFNELGRCFDPETGMVFLEQSGAIWLIITVFAGGIALYQVWRLTR